MNKSKRTWNFKKHFIFSIAIVFVIFLIVFAVGIIQNLFITTQSIGIIGGSDGPTAIFLSSSNSFYFLPALIFLFIFIISLALYKPMKKIIER